MKVCRNTRCAFFFFVDYKNRLIFLSCDILRISLIYVFPASKNSSCKLIKQSNQPIHTFFSHFCTYLFYIEGNGKEGKIHEDLILSKMAETFVIHIVFHLSEHGFRFYASLSSVFQPFLGAEPVSYTHLIDPDAHSAIDTRYSKAYLHHLIKVNEMLGLQLASIHNLAFYLWLVKEARKHIIAGDFTTWKSEMVRQLSNRL